MALSPQRIVGQSSSSTMGPHAEVKEVDSQGHSLALQYEEAKLTLDPLPQRLHAVTAKTLGSHLS